MKKTRILSFLLVFAMLCGLVCIPTTAEVNSADDWQLGKGWSTPSPLIFTCNIDDAQKHTLSFTDPTATEETVGDWSVSYDIYFDESFEAPDQRMNLDITMVSGKTYCVVFQRRQEAKKFRTQLKYDGKDVKFNLSGDAGTINTSGTKSDLWSDNLTANTYAASRLETDFRVTLKSEDGNLTLTIASITDQTIYFTMTEVGATENPVSNAADDAVKSLVFATDKTTTAKNFWDITNIKTAVDGVESTATLNADNYVCETGWALVNFVNDVQSESDKAKYELFTNVNGDFSISYQVDFLDLELNNQNNFTFKLGENTYWVRTGRRYLNNAWQNNYMFGCTNGDGATINFANQWIATTYELCDHVDVVITYDADIASLKVVTKFTNDSTAQVYGRTNIITAGSTYTENSTTDKIVQDSNNNPVDMVMNSTDVLSNISFASGRTEGYYRINGLIIDTEADVNTNGFKLVGVQDTDPAAEKINVRFVGVVDQPEDFQKIGIKVTAYLDGVKHKDFDIATTEVYKAITGSANGVNSTITAEELGGEYVYALTIKGVPASGTVTFEVTPYTVDVNDSSNVTDYATYEVVYQNGEYVSGTKAAE